MLTVIENCFRVVDCEDDKDKAYVDLAINQATKNNMQTWKKSIALLSLWEVHCATES